MTTLQVNGKPLQIDVPDDMPLLWAPVAIKPATRRLLPVHTCPPSPNWHLAPKEMVWVGATPRDICLRLRDPETNGRKTFELLHRFVDDPLVARGWQPGGNRTLPPLTKEQIAAAVKT